MVAAQRAAVLGFSLGFPVEASFSPHLPACLLNIILIDGRRPQTYKVMAGFRKVSAWEEGRPKLTPSMRERAQATKKTIIPLLPFSAPLSVASHPWSRQFDCPAANLSPGLSGGGCGAMKTWL